MLEIIANMNGVLVLTTVGISTRACRISDGLIFVEKFNEITPTDPVSMFGRSTNGRPSTHRRTTVIFLQNSNSVWIHGMEKVVGVGFDNPPWVV
jgi:hypothetical protein